MEPAGKVPQQELLTQNELLKQQVGQDTEPLEARRELPVLDLPGKEPSVARSSPATLAGVSAVMVGSGGPSSASSRPSAGRTTAVGRRANPRAWGLA